MAGTSHPMLGPSPVLDTEPTNTPDQFSFKNATFDEVLEELSSRFILNLPEDELAEVERVCFQVEQAHWYYEDFIREEKPSLPSLPLKKFSEILFRSCPLLHHWSHDHETAFNGFMNYKTRVPVCGAIMLNESLTKCVLVKGWKSSAGWGFPKGKVNENEDEALCAVREVAEETGYNLSGRIRETDCIRLCIKQQPITLFVVPAVPEDFPFKTQTRKEISKIDWFKLADLPTWQKNAPIANKFYLITPVINPLKAIVRNLRKQRKATKFLPQPTTAAQVVELPGANDQLIVERSVTGAAVESPVVIDTSRSQFGEGEVSSSQSSSIDPHTPSANGDLAPHTSDDALVVKPDFSADAQDITMHMGVGGVSVDAMSSGLDIDSRSHWSRLMTRLNSSEENSPRGTPQAVTPTLPITSVPTQPEPLNVLSLRHRTQTANGSTPEGLPNQKHSDYPQKTLRKHSSVVARSASVSSVPFQLQAVPPRVETPKTQTESADVSSTAHLVTSPDALAKRTKQLQLLDSVLAEQSTERSIQQPPKSAHILGTYPHTSNGLFPDQVRVPIRPASVSLDVSRPQSIPFQHQPYFSGLLPAPAPTSSLRHKSIRSSQGHPQLSLPGKGLSVVGRPPTSLPSQPPLTSQSATHLASPSGRAVDSAHRGQMLSILSGETSPLRYTASSLRPGSALRDAAATSRPSHRSQLSATTVGVAPRSANAHLLSILNRPSTAGRISPAPMSVPTRQ